MVALFPLVCRFALLDLALQPSQRKHAGPRDSRLRALMDSNVVVVRVDTHALGFPPLVGASMEHVRQRGLLIAPLGLHTHMLLVLLRRVHRCAMPILAESTRPIKRSAIRLVRFSLRVASS